MANRETKVGDGGVTKVTLDTTGTHNVKNAFGSSRPGSWRLQVVPLGAAPGSLVLKTRMTGSGLTGSNWIAPIYYNDATTTIPSAGDAITTAMKVTVIADRDDLQFEYTSGADGMDVYISPLQG